MAKYRVLKSVAHNIGHSFTSLMNFRGDDYVMGHLLNAARKSGISTLQVDLLSSEAKPRELLPPPVAASVESYTARFPELVRANGSELSFVARATLTVTFDASRTREVSGTPFVESPYKCVVELVDHRGKDYGVTLTGWWYPEMSS